MIMNNVLKTYEPNLLGRDFVVGDLHGSYGIFRNLLNNINFDAAVDRMFSVGDLVDRGPHSAKCLDLIYEPWFHPVLANHEQMMIECFRGGKMGQYWYMNGGAWGAEAVNDHRAFKINKDRVPTDENAAIIDALPLVDDLPYLITVKMRSGKKYHILHAELPQDLGTITDTMLEEPETVDWLARSFGGDGDSFLWNRAVFMHFYKRNLRNRSSVLDALYHNREVLDIFNDELSHIISGHTIMQHPTTIGGQTNIDTGAYYGIYVPPAPYGEYVPTPPEWAGLTCIELEPWKFYRATETTFSEIEPLVFTRDEVYEHGTKVVDKE